MVERQADEWRRGQEIRRFIEAVRAASIAGSDRVLQGNDLERGIEWTSAHADRMNPLVKSPPSILDDRDRWERSYFSDPLALWRRA